MYTCISCKEHSCKKENAEKTPDNCPTLELNLQKRAKQKYLETENYNIAHSAALVEAEGYYKKKLFK